VADSRIDELRRRLERDPGSRLFAQLAEEYRKAGNHADAIRIARTGLAQHPAYPSARLTLGRTLLDSGDPAGARVELETVLREAPDNILASRFLGLALEALGELGPALVQLQKTLKMAPGDRQLESRIVSLETRLRSPQAPPVAPAAGKAPGPPPLPATATSAASTPGWVPPARTPASPLAITKRLPPSVLAAYESDAAPTLPTAHSPSFEPVDETALPTLPPGAMATEETVFEAEPPLVPEVPAAAPGLGETGSPGASPFSSSTLAELYLKQGLVGRAVEVYRQLLAEEPGNERARARLAEIERVPSPAAPRAARRQALERTIAGLEALLAVVQRR